MRHRVTSALGVLVATLTLLPNVLAQKGSRSRTTRPPAAAPVAAAPLSHDLSGIWMQYADGTEPGFARMNGVDDRVRPSLTSWGQAKFDAAKPLMGPRAVGGAEDSAALHCEPSGAPHLAHHLDRRAATSQRSRPQLAGVLGWQVGGRHVRYRNGWFQRQSVGRSLWESAQRRDAPYRTLPPIEP